MKAYQIGNQTSAAHALDGHLCGLCLLLAVDQGHVADVDLHEVVSSSAHSELRHGLDKGHALDVTNRTSQLDDAHVRLLTRVIDGDFCNSFNPVLDGVDNVRHHLDRVAEVVTSALLLDDVGVDFTGCNVVLAGQGNVEVTLVVAEIEVDFTAIVENKDFSMPF